MKDKDENIKNNRIFSTLSVEFGKLLIRSEEKSHYNNKIEAAIKFIESHHLAFDNHEQIISYLKESKFEKLCSYILDENETSDEPCLMPYIPGLTKSKKNNTAFLVHIFKGEQDITPLEINKINIVPKQYSRIFHSLKHDIKRIEKYITLEQWLALLERYGKWVPAAKHLQHVSLYSYAKIKTILASCLTEEEIDSFVKKIEENTSLNDKVLNLFAIKLVGYDNFILDFNPKRELNYIKGAQYYLQLFMEELKNDILKKLDLPSINYISMNKDYSIFIIRNDYVNKAQEIVENISQFLKKHLDNRLKLIYKSVPCDLELIKGKELINTIYSILLDFEKKDKIFSDVNNNFKEDYKNLFGPYVSEDKEEKWRDFNKSLIELGKSLSKARWILEEERDLKKVSLAKNWKEMLNYFKKEYKFINKNPYEEKEKRGKDSKIKYSDPIIPELTLYRFGNTDFASYYGKGFKFSNTLTYLLADETIDQVKYWSIINIVIDKSAMDFTDQTLASFITRKEHLNNFFKTYLASLLREKKYRRQTFNLFLNEDRITIVTSASIALPLLYQIHKKFKIFTEDKFTLCARIGVYNADYPINQALYEERKKFELRGNLRNKIILLDEVVPWSFLESILKAQEKLSTISKLKGKRFLFSLFGISEIYKIRRKEREKINKKDEKNKKEILRWKNLINYYFYKLGITDNLEKHMLESDRGALYLNLAIRWNYYMSFEI